MLGSMAEPSLLCVNCARPPPPHRRTWGRCTICVARNLPSTYYCGQECMKAHWPKHQQYHKEQKDHAQQRREGTFLDTDRSIAEAQARRAEQTGDEFDKRFADALALVAEGDNDGATIKAWRKLIKERPEAPAPYYNLAIALDRSDRNLEAATMFLKAMELYSDGTEAWADSAASAFNLLRISECGEMPKPEWWNDEGLKALSARVVTVAPDLTQSCAMRALVLSGSDLSESPWNAGPRTAAEIKEAATWFRGAAMLTHTSAREKLRFKRLASQCDEYADPLLAKEEAEAAKARAAAKAEAAKARAAAKAKAAEALKAAEAKATAAAEELLAEEEKEKEQASTKAGKAKQSKGKKGKGNGKR